MAADHTVFCSLDHYEKGRCPGHRRPRTVVMEMPRGLLANQFELKTHSENREVDHLDEKPIE